MKRWKELFVAEVLLLLLLCSTNKHLIIAFISIFIHEVSHVIVASIKGSKFNKLHINVYGSKVELSNLDELDDKSKIKIYVAGSAANFIIILLFLCIGLYMKTDIINEVININLGLILFNLLPAYPLDGARILEILLSKKMLYKNAQAIIFKISYIISISFVLIFTGIAWILNIYNISLLFAAIIIAYITRREEKTSMYILMGNIFMKRNKFLKNKFLENRSISVYYKQGLVNLMAIIDKNRFNTFYILDDDLNIIFIMHEDELIEALKVYGNISLEEYYEKKSGKSL